MTSRPPDPVAKEAANLLWRHWRGGTTLDALPGHLCPADRASAYRVQALLETRSERPLFGWKIAATSIAGQKHINVDGPLAGRIIADMVVPPGGVCDLGPVHMRLAEAEFAFRMAHDLPPRAAPYTMEEVVAAAGALHVGIEIPDSRYVDCTRNGAVQIIADNACGHAFFLGPECPALWRGLDLSKHQTRGLVLSGDGETRLEWPGSGANVLGDPRVALAWLANELSGLGVTLRAAEVVTTGTCVPPMPVAPGETFVADFATLGTALLRFR